MSTVQRINGTMVEGVEVTDVRTGEEGSKIGIAHIDGERFRVHNSSVDGFNSIWHEQEPAEKPLRSIINQAYRI